MIEWTSKNKKWKIEINDYNAEHKHYSGRIINNHNGLSEYFIIDDTFRRDCIMQIPQYIKNKIQSIVGNDITKCNTNFYKISIIELGLFDINKRYIKSDMFELDLIMKAYPNAKKENNHFIDNNKKIYIDRVYSFDELKNIEFEKINKMTVI